MDEKMEHIAQGQESAFPKEEYAERLSKAQTRLAHAKLDALVITGPENIFYLTGQQTPGYYTFQAMLLPEQGDPVFVIRQLEVFNFIANTYIADAQVYQDGEDPIPVLLRVLQNRGLSGKRVGIDKRGWFLPIAVYERLQSALGDVHDGAGLIETLRAIKSPREIAKLETAATYADAGMRAGLAAVRLGATDNDLAAAMMQAAIAAGSEYMGMEPLVSTGRRTGIPHGTWRRTPLAAHEPAFLEMAAVHDRYHAALMRSAWVGTIPREAQNMMQVCQDALAAALDRVKPGATCEAPHLACQQVIDAAGYTDNFRKRLGYSIGISFAPDWGEGAILSLNAGVTTALEPGMTFHLPPALRIYGQFTVGVSETIVVTQTGWRQLSTLPRDMTRVAM